MPLAPGADTSARPQFAAARPPEQVPAHSATVGGVTLPLLEAPEVVLSTLNRDGSRRWLRPRVSHGRFLNARRMTAYGLIALFTLIPHIRLAEKPLILLDIAKRQFTFFGATFLPTDTVLLALFMISVFVSIFLFTAVFGRIWCGWACPQTVYLEFVYRPLQRLFEGTAGRGGKPGRPPAAWRKAVQYFSYLLVSMFLAHTFLAYFVGVDALKEWVRLSPLQHTTPFLVMLVTTGLMMFNFCYFREQTCLLACPYGRFQSALVDRNSLIVSYDAARGEPRGRVKTAEDISQPRGDCVDCGLCVATCPTGIDIRDGLQMECVGCTQCIDACDTVMDKVHRPRGLIRYTSQARLAGERGRVARGRIFVYGTVLTIAIGAFLITLYTRPAADVRVLRGMGLPFHELPSGLIANPVRVKLTNRTDQSARYTVSIEGVDGATFNAEADIPILAPGQTAELPGLITLPRERFVGGQVSCTVVVTDGAAFTTRIKQLLLGPWAAKEGDAK